MNKLCFYKKVETLKSLTDSCSYIINIITFFKENVLYMLYQLPSPNEYTHVQLFRYTAFFS